jgi:hypothetical protein
MAITLPLWQWQYGSWHACGYVVLANNVIDPAGITT